MKCNVGHVDKTIRLLAAAEIAAAGFHNQSWWGFLAIVPLLTALFSFCPLYSLVGVNTCKTIKF